MTAADHDQGGSRSSDQVGKHGHGQNPARQAENAAGYRGPGGASPLFLGWRRTWWHLAAFAAAIAASEVLIGTLKGIYDRARPPGSLVATSGASFPSGHSVAAPVTVVAAVIALVPAERRRAMWGGAAVAFSILMAFSRAYLGAHGLSDAMAGLLLGTACALLAALVAPASGQRGRRAR
jgi:membrane-associated phospholipid phosphatase